MFQGHYQPHLPADLGFYDLRLPEARAAQAELAAAYGIHGFCYYYYWFHGRRLLERPLNEVLASGRPRLPFCVCWANEPWTRAWDGGSENILVEQTHDADDDVAFIHSLMPAFRDERYIRVNGKPLLLVYRVGLFPDARRTADIWREETRRAGLEAPYLVQMRTFDDMFDPATVGFDAATQFAGHDLPPNAGLKLVKNPTNFAGVLLDYRIYMEHLLNSAMHDYKVFRCVMPSWDNTPRRGNTAGLFLGGSPELYGQWLRRAIDYTREQFQADERLVFVNAWNEWGEGCHLEPDQRHGRRFLEETKTALDS